MIVTIGNVTLNENTTDLDLPADQCVVGSNLLIVQDYDKPVSVWGFDPSGPTNSSLQTVSAALAYDCPSTGQTNVLVVHQAIYLPTMQHNLLATMQLRWNDVIMNDVPKFLTDKPNETTHTVTVRGQSADPDDRIVIPLMIHGVTSSFPTRKPSAQEYESCRPYDLTFESPDYDPHDITYSSQE
jgi:hypothetical protein